MNTGYLVRLIAFWQRSYRRGHLLNDILTGMAWVA
jgi:hypothetical protein